MRITLITFLYPPEGSPAGKRMQALADALTAAGHRVRVIAPAPSYPHSKLFEGYGGRLLDRRMERGVEVLRFRPRIAPRENIRRRAVAELLNALVILVLAVVHRADVVVATTPSLVLGPAGLVAARLTRRRFVWDIRDLFWLYAAELGKVRSRLLLRAVERVMIGTGALADRLTTTTQAQRSYFVDRGLDSARISVVPNGVDDSFFRATVACTARPPRGREDRLRVVYGGLVGYAQGLGVLIDAAVRLDPARWEVVIAGDGAERPELQRAAEERGLHHVRFLGYVTSAELVECYRDGDILYAQLRCGPAMKTAQPTKLLDYMSAGRPVVFGGEGAGAELLAQTGAGVVIPPDRVDALVAALEALRDPGERTRLGVAGRAYVEAHGRRSHGLAAFVSAVTGRGGETEAAPLRSPAGARAA
jgi:colanic acid biosynthesis glycosyl transferase WcaI